MRLAVALVVGVVTALALFLLMHQLISVPGESHVARPARQLVDFIRVAPDEVTRARPRRKPVLPPPPQRLPPPPTVIVTAQEMPPVQPPAIETPDIGVPALSGDGLYLGAFDAAAPLAEGEIIPLVRIQPRYPREALIEGIEGWVDVEFTIVEDGTVADPVVIDAQPGRIFNRAALRAIRRWKFKPRIVDGRAVSRRASQRIEFLLEQS